MMETEDSTMKKQTKVTLSQKSFQQKLNCSKTTDHEKKLQMSERVQTS